MAEILIAARDRPSGYKKGDPVIAKPDGWRWRRREGLPNFWQIAVSGLPVALVQAHIIPLWELAIIGDPEYESPDESDRRIQRHRMAVRVMWDEIPAAWTIALDTVGRLEITAAEGRPYIRKLRYNRGNSQVEKTAEEIF
jgi:hypothetical protein